MANQKYNAKKEESNTRRYENRKEIKKHEQIRKARKSSPRYN